MKQIWDPLRKKYVTATPEEQVRQWFITQLRDLFGVPMGLMMSEAPLTFGLKKFRADIVVYDRQLRPLLIVECKRPEVQIDAGTQIQFRARCGIHRSDKRKFDLSLRAERGEFRALRQSPFL